MRDIVKPAPLANDNKPVEIIAEDSEENLLKNTRKKGIASESALDEKVLQEQISSAYEKHRKQYQSAPRTFTYDKLNKIEGEDSIDKPKTRQSFHGRTEYKKMSTAPNFEPKQISSISEKRHSDTQIKNRNQIQKTASQGGETTSHPTIVVQTEQTILERQTDREISTSYTESLDIMLKQQQEAKQKYDEMHETRKRLSMLQEEYTSRPTSVLYSDPGTPQIGSPSPDYFDDFIQYTSQDILYEPKKKVAKVIGRYVLGDMLGEGSYGKVKEGFCTETLHRVAVKIMKQSKLKKIPGGEQNVKREIALLKRLRHENIVELKDIIYKTEKQKIYVVLEYCATTLQELLSRAPDKKLPLGQTQRYFIQIVTGLEYLHANSVIHRDIKPGNLLLTFDETIKISDFGVAESLDRYSNSDLLTTSQGSPAFQPPEVAGGTEKFSGIMVDIWAIGVTLFHMISGKYPFDGDSIYHLFDNISKCVYKVPEEADELLSDLVVKIMEKDPSKRLPLPKIKEHNWLKTEFPKSDNDVKIIPVIDSQLGSSISQELEQETSKTSEEKLDLPEMVGHLSHISNPHFAYDTTLIPYLEHLFEELPHSLRRSSVVEQDYVEKSRKKHMRSVSFRKSAIAEKFLKRLSKPISDMSDQTLKLDVKEKSRPVSANSAAQKSTKSRNSTLSRSLFSKSDSEKCKVQ